jgi:sugar phosphate isomerase/epimerase
MNRRHFLTGLTTTVAACSCRGFLHALEPDNIYRKTIGIQLYTLRKQLAEDTRATIEAVAKMGYKQVEAYSFPNCDVVIEAADEFGLELNSAHILWNSVLKPQGEKAPPYQQLLEKAHQLKIKHLVIPTINKEDRTPNGYRRVAELCNKAAAKAKEAGIRLSYHNHSFEFDRLVDGSCGYDILMVEFSDEMLFELDVFWAKVGRRDPLELLHRLKNRVCQLHLKDLNGNVKLPEKVEGWWSLTEETFEELGDGIIPTEPILDAAADAGVSICHVEQDLSPDPLASIERSLKYLHTL